MTGFRSIRPESVGSDRSVPKVFFVVHVDAYFTAWIDLFAYLRRQGGMSPVVVFPRQYPSRAKHLAFCSQEGIEFIDEDLEAQTAPGARQETTDIGASTRVRAVDVFIARVRNRVFAIPPMRLWTALRRQQRLLDRIRGMLARDPPSLIVLGGDIVGHSMCMFIKAGHELGIPSVLTPGWMAGPLEAAEHHFGDLDYSCRRVINHLFGSVFPQWAYVHRGRKLLRLPAEQALALQIKGLAPPRPWILHSGHADLVAVESEAARAYGIREGLAADRLAVTGSLANDRMTARLARTDALKTECLDRFGMTSASRLILCALPPNMLRPIGARPACDFGDYRSLVRFWITTLANLPDTNVLLSLHPSSRREDIDFTDTARMKVADMPVADLIPLCDIYVASISATIQWATACGKPVINYDVYRYRYVDYHGLQGIVALEERDEFSAALLRITADSAFTQTLAAAQKAVAHDWGVLDGMSGKRLVDAFRCVVAGSGDKLLMSRELGLGMARNANSIS